MPLNLYWRHELLRFSRAVALLSGCALASGCGVVGAPLNVSIPALPSENLSGPCLFELSLSEPTHAQKGVLVLYERGDTERLYNDARLRRSLQAIDYAVVWAHECDARSTGDLQADASQGPARTLFAALDQFAAKSGHTELSSAGVMLYGFSAAGVLTATMAHTHPDRLIGTIQYAAGSAHTDLDDVVISTDASRIPSLILANAHDERSGTARSLSYFERGRALGAPWAYAVQNGTGHCCNLSTQDVILPWIADIAALHTGDVSAISAASAPLAGIAASFVCTPDGVEDAQDSMDCNFTESSLEKLSSSHSHSGWLPSESSANAWLGWVRNPSTN